MALGGDEGQGNSEDGSDRELIDAVNRAVAKEEKEESLLVSGVLMAMGLIVLLSPVLFVLGCVSLAASYIADFLKLTSVVCSVTSSRIRAYINKSLK